MPVDLLARYVSAMLADLERAVAEIGALRARVAVLETCAIDQEAIAPRDVTERVSADLKPNPKPRPFVPVLLPPPAFTEPHDEKPEKTKKRLAKRQDAATRDRWSRIQFA
jgi:hypothetical protein